MYIDTHCHLNFHSFAKDVDSVIKKAKAAGVEKIIIPGAKINSSEKAIEIAQKYDDCFAAVGVHPHHVDDVLMYQSSKLSEAKSREAGVLKGRIIELAKNRKVVAIGECGLDYFEYQKTDNESNKITSEIKEKQKELLKIHLEIAEELNLPVIVHCREAFEDMLPIVAKHSPNDKHLRGVFHCFGGSTDDLKRILDLGFYIGFDGNITYESAGNLRILVSKTPTDRILLETDSPYLAPEPDRRTRNEPKNVTIIAQMIAKIKKLDPKEVEIQTSNNAVGLFALS